MRIIQYTPETVALSAFFADEGTLTTTSMGYNVCLQILFVSKCHVAVGACEKLFSFGDDLVNFHPKGTCKGSLTFPTNKRLSRV